LRGIGRRCVSGVGEARAGACGRGEEPCFERGTARQAKCSQEGEEGRARASSLASTCRACYRALLHMPTQELCLNFRAINGEHCIIDCGRKAFAEETCSPSVQTITTETGTIMPDDARINQRQDCTHPQKQNVLTHVQSDSAHCAEPVPPVQHCSSAVQAPEGMSMFPAVRLRHSFEAGRVGCNQIQKDCTVSWFRMTPCESADGHRDPEKSCEAFALTSLELYVLFHKHPVIMAAWRNGIASDYDLSVASGDCRFDPCGGHFDLHAVTSFFFFPLLCQ
jgi:hypothetical protein